MKDINLEILLDVCDKKGWEFCASQQASDHPTERHLLYCAIVNEKNEGVSYLFNAIDKAFYSGHYFRSAVDAMRDMETR